MVLESYCGYNGWNLKQIWSSQHLHITPCLCDTLFLWTALGFLWIASPFQIWATRRSLKPLPWSLLVIVKMTLVSLLMGLNVYELIVSLVKSIGKDDETIEPIDYCTPLIKLLSYALAGYIQLRNRHQGIRTSGLLFIFWFLMSIYHLLFFLTLAGTPSNPIEQSWTSNALPLVSRLLSTLSCLSQLVFYCLNDSRASKDKVHVENECPYTNASFVNRILFFWYDSMAYKGFKKPLVQSDMWPLMEENRSAVIVEKFKPLPVQSVASSENGKADLRGVRSGTSEANKSAPKFNTLKTIVTTWWPLLIAIGICKLFSASLTFANPQLLDALLTVIATGQPSWKGYIIASGIFVASLFRSILESQYEFWIQTVSMRIRTALISTVYRKSLRLSSSGRKDFTVGEIVNLVSVDIQRIVDFINVAYFTWSAPIQLGITVYLLWRQLGASSLAGLGGMLALMPFNGLIAARFEKLQAKIMKAKDARMKLLSEILAGVKVLKLYAWEGAFGDIVASIRKDEMGALISQSILSSGFVFSFGLAPFCVTVISFITFVLSSSKHILDANRAFVSISLIATLNEPLTLLPMVVTFGANALISVRRINKYLDGDELQPDAISHDPQPSTPIIVKDAEFTWSPSEETSTLKEVNMRVHKNKLVAIVGTVGSGKSSLLGALLGDLFKVKGYVNVDGKIGYIPQSAWIINATVRDNIIFGSPMDQNKYDQVLKCCALVDDLKIFEGGDETEIGERGINVSGGQKQRISIARAVYSDSDVYLFDDPLSAVDAHVAKHLFDQVIGPSGILQNKTRVLVTHRLTFLSQVDEIIVMKEGNIDEVGTYNELIDAKGGFAELIETYSKEKTDDEDETDKQVEPIETNEKKDPLPKSRSMSSDQRETRKRSSVPSTIEKAKSESAPVAKLIEAENKETGSVSLKVYLNYFKAIGYKNLGVSLALFAMASCLNYSTNLWLSKWADDALNPMNMFDTSLRNRRLTVYTVLGVSEAFVVLINSIAVFVSIVKGARWIHKKMLNRLIRAPMSFFDTTPAGRILNRFTHDIDVADNTMKFDLYFSALFGFHSIVALIAICRNSPYLIILIIVLGIIYGFVQKFYISTTRELRRIESASRSPINSHLSETVSGATSVRSYGAEERFINEIDNRIDANQSCFFPKVVADRWLAIRLELLGNIVVTAAAFYAILNRDNSTPGATGLAISYALQITALLIMMVRQVSNVENNIVSVERCLEYTNIAIEAPWTRSTPGVDKNWPEKGEIAFNGYATRYRPGLDLVLKNVACTIKPGEKVGIVGRTGAGKSSLTLALFRLIEPASGTIKIDGVDIADLGLHDLRSRLTIIPQDPVLFSGSLRRNLDPFQRHSDEEIWSALEQANLKSYVNSLDTKLEYEIAEAGENLSVGQRQLVCLTRALLRKTKVLILDEATAAVDIETDDLIQNTIRREFNECTIVTIAHRLNTIIDYDKIIVMDKGEVAEYDEPQNLLNNERTIFHSMAREAKLI